MNRRTFLGLAAGAVLTRTASPATPPANHRERMLAWLAGQGTPGYTPAAFFLHFGEGYQRGSAAAQRHLEFYRHTGMDFVKIQFEQTYTRQEFLQKPADWSRLKPVKLEFYEPLLQTLRDLVKAEKKRSLIVMTLYSPFMGAAQCATAPVLVRHLEENPEAVKKGLEILTQNQMLFVRACIREGVDGFYASTQGGEADRFPNPQIFRDFVKPFDLVAMKEMDSACPFNILHVCDYVAPYANYDTYRDYPGHIVNCNVQLKNRQLSLEEIHGLFERPFMGGMDRHGILAKGSPAQMSAEVERVIRSSPRPLLLGADCTVAADTSWDRLRQAIAVAHRTGAGSRQGV